MSRACNAPAITCCAPFLGEISSPYSISTANTSSGALPASCRSNRNADAKAIHRCRKNTTNSPLRHQLTDPDSGDILPCRVIFAFSSADQKVCQAERQRSVAHIRAGLEQIAQSVADGHFSWHDPVQIQRRVVKLLGASFQRCAAVRARG
jgi:hypothetical protein